MTDPAPKVTLLEMILWAEQEADRIEVWERVLASEGRALEPHIARAGQVSRQTVKALELMKMHEQEFVAVVKKRRAEQAAALRAASPSRPAAAAKPEPEPEPVAAEPEVADDS
jgi:hypothetical protein